MNNVYVNILQNFIYEYLFKNKIEQKKRFAELNMSRLVCLFDTTLLITKNNGNKKKIIQKVRKNFRYFLAGN